MDASVVRASTDEISYTGSRISYWKWALRITSPTLRQIRKAIDSLPSRQPELARTIPVFQQDCGVAVTDILSFQGLFRARS